MLKKNDIIKNKDGYYRKILGIVDGLYFISDSCVAKEDVEKVNIGRYFYTLQGLKDAGYEIPEEKEEMTCKKCGGEFKTGDIVSCEYVPGGTSRSCVHSKCLPEDKWEHEEGEEYWFVGDNGKIYHDYWEDDEVDHDRRDFLGVFPTEEAAKERLEEIKKLIN